MVDTPIFDGVLGDRLAAARAAVELAGRQAAAFREALDAGRAHALEQLAQSRAQALTAKRTAALTARVEVLERALLTAHRERAAALAELQQRRGAGPAPVTPTAVAPTVEVVATGDSPPAHDRAPVPLQSTPPTAATIAVTTVAPTTVAATTTATRAAAAVNPAPAATVTRPAVARSRGRLAGDDGPAAEDVPSVPSMKDLLGSTRAAGWLDSLLGARR